MSWRTNPGRSLAAWLPKFVVLVCALCCIQITLSVQARDNQIRLTIVDDQGRSLPDVSLEVEFTVLGEPEPRLLSDLSDSAGRSVLDLPDVAVISISITCRASRKVGRMVRRFDSSSEPVPLDLPFEHTIRMQSGKPLAGKIVDADGAPVSGASLRVSLLAQDVPQIRGPQFGTRFEYGEATSGENGLWELPAVPDDPELLVRLIVDHPGYGGPVVVERPKNGMSIALPNAASVKGQVSDSGGNPVHGAAVRFGHNAWSPTIPTAVTDQYGNFVVRGCWPGKSGLTVQADGFAPQTVMVTASPGQIESADIQLGAPHTLTARVIDPRGNPVVDASVRINRRGDYRLLRWQSQTDRDGKFIWQSAPAGPLSLEIWKEGYLWSDQYELVAGQSAADVMLWPRIDVSGTLNYADSDLPVTDIRVCGVTLDGNGAVTRLRNQMAANDSYSFSFWRLAKSYEIRFFPRGTGSAHAKIGPFDNTIGPLVHDVILEPSSQINLHERARQDLSEKIATGTWSMSETSAIEALVPLGATIVLPKQPGGITNVVLTSPFRSKRGRDGRIVVEKVPVENQWTGSLQDLRWLEDIKEVHLHVRGWELTPELITRLASIRTISLLHLDGVWMLQPEEFAMLGQLIHVRDLIFSGDVQNFPRPGIEALSRLPNLEGLQFRLRRSNLQHATFDGLLEEFPLLKRLSITDPEVDLGIISSLEKMEQLESLALRCEVDDEFISRIPANSRFQNLELHGNQVTDYGLATIIQRFPNLDSLTLTDTGITRRGIQLLAERPLPKLRSLVIQDICPRKDLVHLQWAMPECRIMIENVATNSDYRTMSRFDLRSGERFQSLSKIKSDY